MIQYQKITPEYAQKAYDYCKLKEVDFPTDAEIIFIAINELDAVIGLCSVKQIFQIEPLVSDQPLVTMILGEKAMSVVATTKHEKVMALVKDSKESYISQLEKYGFVVTDKAMTILKKEV